MKPVKGVNHVGIAVRSIDAQRSFYEGTLGAVFEGVEEVGAARAVPSNMRSAHGGASPIDVLRRWECSRFWCGAPEGSVREASRGR